MAALNYRIQDTLDECRMLILGGQVVMMLAAESVFEPAFERLSGLARALLAAQMVGLVVAIGLLIWPAAYHRIVCRGRDEPRLHRFATRVLCAALVPFAVALAVGLFVTGERVGVSGAVLGAIVFLLSIGAWYAYPMLARARRTGRKQEPSMAATHDGEADSPPRHGADKDLADKIRHVLTEARMVLPGAQALLGFGVLAALMDSFEKFPPVLKAVHLAGLCFIALAVVLLMTPAAYHRIAERGEHTERFHRVAGRLLLGAMAALAPGVAAALWIVLERTSGSRTAGAAAAVLTLIAFYGAWFGWTLAVRERKAVS
jgi:hypothetical protein